MLQRTKVKWKFWPNLLLLCLVSQIISLFARSALFTTKNHQCLDFGRREREGEACNRNSVQSAIAKFAQNLPLFHRQFLPSLQKFTPLFRKFTGWIGKLFSIGGKLGSNKRVSDTCSAPVVAISSVGKILRLRTSADSIGDRVMTRYWLGHRDDHL